MKMSTDRIIAIAGCAVGVIGIIVGSIGIVKAGNVAADLKAATRRQSQQQSRASKRVGKDLGGEIEKLKTASEKDVRMLNRKIDQVDIKILPDLQLQRKILELAGPRIDQVSGRVNELRADTGRMIDAAKTEVRSEIRQVNESVLALKVAVPEMARNEAVQQLKSLGLK